MDYNILECHLFQQNANVPQRCSNIPTIINIMKMIQIYTKCITHIIAHTLNSISIHLSLYDFHYQYNIFGMLPISAERKCSTGMFQCDNGTRCLYYMDVCDGSAECTDKADEDETMCQMECPPGEFKCTAGRSVINESNFYNKTFHFNRSITIWSYDGIYP